MLRSFVKSALAYGLSRSGAAGLMRSSNGWRNGPLVLGYHRVVENFTRESRNSIPSMLVTSSMLEKHLDWVGQHYQFVSMQEACSLLRAREPFPRPSALVTFDDGYQDVYQNAMPLLSRKGIPAAVFVVTRLVGTNKPQIHDELYLLISTAQSRWRKPAEEFAAILSILGIRRQERLDLQSLFFRDPFALTGKLLDRLCLRDIQRIVEAFEAAIPGRNPELEGLRPLSWQMLKEMRQGGFAIGSHTASHALLTNESMADVLRELKSSRLELEARLGDAVPYFAYPDGRFNSQVVRAVKSCGYTFGFSTCTHRDPDYPLLTIPRKVLWEKSCVDRFGSFDPAVMECQITRLFDLMAPCPQNHQLPAVSPELRKVLAHARLERS
jgi:peptidoglycan/xylan/chitin deacetylase (PgdA/CDA1 family)